MKSFELHMYFNVSLRINCFVKHTYDLRKLKRKRKVMKKLTKNLRYDRKTDKYQMQRILYCISYFWISDFFNLL
jgi:hypothetical protein